MKRAGLVLTCALWALAGAVQSEAPDGASAALNGFRDQAGLSRLSADPRLQAMAEAHAKDMKQRGYFSHTSPEGGTLPDRAKAAGYRFCSIAENIAKGQRNLSSVMQAWAKSAGHKANLAKRDVTGFGLAHVPPYWVLVLGRDGC